VRESEPETIAVAALAKIGAKRHMTELREEGLLFCNPLAYFRSEESGQTRRDRRDGISSSHLATDVVAVVVSNPDGETRLTPENGLTGRVDVHLGGPEPNVYCMYAFRSADRPFRADPRIYEFGDSGVLITDLDQFDERLKAAVLRERLELHAGLVEYVDTETFSGDLGVFRKFSEFDFQREVRFAIDPGNAEPIQIRLGPIDDISIQFDVHDETCVELIDS